ncbi:hypothetical protein COP2_044548 [Malus domestica]
MVQDRSLEEEEGGARRILYGVPDGGMIAEQQIWAAQIQEGLQSLVAGVELRKHALDPCGEIRRVVVDGVGLLSNEVGFSGRQRRRVAPVR